MRSGHARRQPGRQHPETSIFEIEASWHSDSEYFSYSTHDASWPSAAEISLRSTYMTWHIYSSGDGAKTRPPAMDDLQHPCGINRPSERHIHRLSVCHAMVSTRRARTYVVSTARPSSTESWSGPRTSRTSRPEARTAAVRPWVHGKRDEVVPSTAELFTGLVVLAGLRKTSFQSPRASDSLSDRPHRRYGV